MLNPFPWLSGGLSIVGLIVLLLLQVFWVVQFVKLMTLSERQFPWRYDKALWVAAFVLTNVLAAFAFYYWTRVMVATTEIEREDETPPGLRETQ